MGAPRARSLHPSSRLYRMSEFHRPSCSLQRAACPGPTRVMTDPDAFKSSSCYPSCQRRRLNALCSAHHDNHLAVLLEALEAELGELRSRRSDRVLRALHLLRDRLSCSTATGCSYHATFPLG